LRFCSIDRSDQGIWSGDSAPLNQCSIFVRLIEKNLQLMLDSSRLIETHKTKSFAKFSGDCSEFLKCFKPCEQFYEIL